MPDTEHSADSAAHAQQVPDLLDRAPCGFLSFHDDGRIRLVNATLLQMLDYTGENLEGRHIETLLTVGTRIFYQTHWFPLLRMHGRAEEIFLLLRSRQGEQVGVLANAARRGSGDSAFYDCVFMQVRERQKYEEELLRARRAADQARDEVTAQKRALEETNRLLAAQAEELELQQQQLHEQTVELELTGEELRASNDELLERTEELNRLRVVAEDANRAKSEFLAVMSHELRTPLNAISGYADLIDMGIHGPVTDAQHDALERIKRSQLHLLRLINEVLNLARIEAGHIDYDIEDVALAKLVQDVMPMVEPQLAAKRLTLETAVAGSAIAVADREKVQQIVLNLLSNAIKFTPAGGRITVRTATRDEVPDTVFLAVSDTGIGIAPNKLAAVFEPFVQVDVSRTTRKEGTGLGLAISRDLARGMGGDLRARSTEGAGSTFTLSLPRRAAPSGRE
jgi:PAS domain S-box-containing protein